MFHSPRDPAMRKRSIRNFGAKKRKATDVRVEAVIRCMDAGLTKTESARALGIAPGNLDRLLNSRHIKWTGARGWTKKESV